MSLKIVFILANSTDTDEIQPYLAFHFCQSVCLPVSRMKFVIIFQLFHGAALAYVFCNLMVADNKFKMEHEYSYDLKGTATMIKTMFYMKDRNKP